MEGLHNPMGEGVLGPSIFSPTSEVGKTVTGAGFSFPVPQNSTGMSTPTSCAGAGLLGGQVAGVLVCGYEESGHGWVPSWGSPGVSGWRVAVAGLSYGSAFPSCVTVDDKPLDSSQNSESYQPLVSSWWVRMGSSVVLTLCPGTEFLGWTPDLGGFSTF